MTTLKQCRFISAAALTIGISLFISCKNSGTPNQASSLMDTQNTNETWRSMGKHRFFSKMRYYRLESLGNKDFSGGHHYYPLCISSALTLTASFGNHEECAYWNWETNGSKNRIRLDNTNSCITAGAYKHKAELKDCDGSDAQNLDFDYKDYLHISNGDVSKNGLCLDAMGGYQATLNKESTDLIFYNCKWIKTTTAYNQRFEFRDAKPQCSGLSYDCADDTLDWKFTPEN